MCGFFATVNNGLNFQYGMPEVLEENISCVKEEKKTDGDILNLLASLGVSNEIQLYASWLQSNNEISQSDTDYLIPSMCMCVGRRAGM